MDRESDLQKTCNKVCFLINFLVSSFHQKNLFKILKVLDKLSFFQKIYLPTLLSEISRIMENFSNSQNNIWVKPASLDPEKENMNFPAKLNRHQVDGNGKSIKIRLEIPRSCTDLLLVLRWMMPGWD